MPKWASRITLRVNEVKAERLHEITDDGAAAEGIPLPNRDGFSLLWDEINGKREGARWDDNPWVWVIKFEVLETSGARGERPEGGE